VRDELQLHASERPARFLYVNLPTTTTQLVVDLHSLVLVHTESNNDVRAVMCGRHQVYSVYIYCLSCRRVFVHAVDHLLDNVVRLQQ